MDGWMDGWCENSGGNYLGHGRKAPISRSTCHQQFLNSGFADPRNLGFGVIELLTCQLMAGNFGQPRPAWTAVEREGIQSTQPPWVPMGIKEGWGGAGLLMHTPPFGCRSCSPAPQATPPGYSPRGDSTRGNALRVPRGNNTTGCEEGGRGLVEERRRHIQAAHGQLGWQ